MSRSKPDFFNPTDLKPGIRPERIKIEIHCDNDAFVPYHQIEVVRILKELVAKYEGGDEVPHVLRDLNGNTCGHVSIY